MTLKDLPIRKTATIRSVGGEGALRQHFLDMELIPKGDVTMVKYAPMGDPMELRIHSYELTLRLADADKIEIENVRDAGEKGETSKKTTAIPSLIRDWEKAENFILRKPNIPFRTVKCLPLHWQETRTAERQLCLISLPAPASMWKFPRCYCGQKGRTIRKKHRIHQ